MHPTFTAESGQPSYEWIPGLGAAFLLCVILGIICITISVCCIRKKAGKKEAKDKDKSSNGGAGTLTNTEGSRSTDDQQTDKEAIGVTIEPDRGMHNLVCVLLLACIYTVIMHVYLVSIQSLNLHLLIWMPMTTMVDQLLAVPF